MQFTLECKVENIDGQDLYRMKMESNGSAKYIDMSLDCAQDDDYVLSSVERLYYSFMPDLEITEQEISGGDL